MSERLAQNLYVGARKGFEPATLRMQGTELTNEPPRPTIPSVIYETDILMLVERAAKV